MVYNLRFFSSSKCSLFHNSNLFGSCIIHILYTGVLKLKKNNSGAKRLIPNTGLGKISSLLSVGHCERRGGRRKVGLGSKGEGSREVPVTTLLSRKYSVVERAARICRRNRLFAKPLS